MTLLGGAGDADAQGMVISVILAVLVAAVVVAIGAAAVRRAVRRHAAADAAAHAEVADWLHELLDPVPDGTEPLV